MTIFNDSKYTRWYYAIVAQRAITDRRRKGEVHHIIPRSLGGSDDASNLVKLSGHDHAWCHWLLTKMTEGEAKSKMVYAFRMMEVEGDHMDRQKSYAIVKAYEKNRIVWSKNHSEKMKGKKPWNKDRKLDDEKYSVGGRKNKGRVHTDEENEAKRLRQLGKKQSAEASDKKRQKMLGFVRGPQSDEHRLLISQGSKGHKKSDSHGDNVAAANRGVTIINKDGVEKRVKGDLQPWLDLGWTKGRPPKESKKRGPYKKKQTA
jgi:hypothetical protein